MTFQPPFSAPFRSPFMSLGTAITYLLRDEFTTDDVWDILDGYAMSTHERRAMGPVMKKAQKLGLVVPTGQFILSHRPVCNKRPVMVWKSAVDE